VLVVDDNAVVRHGVARVLRSEGHRVVEAENGMVALVEVERCGFGAIVLDLMMPVMDGVACFQALEAAYPEAARRVLFVTAWADEPELHGFLAGSGRPVLQKPFDVEALVAAVRRVIAPVTDAA
jgi:CheY-like chemotaxis protein